MRALPFLSNDDPKLDLLASVPLFAGVSRRRLRRLASLLDEADLPEGALLVHQGELAREFVVIVTGNATVERDGVTIGNVGPGAMVGEMALLGRRGRRSATVRALEPMRVLVGDSRVLDAVLDVDAQVRRAVESTARNREARNAA